MNVDVMLSAVVVRILFDTELRDLFGGRVYKQPARPTGITPVNPSLCVNILTNPQDYSAKGLYRGTIVVKFFIDNLEGGRANTEELGRILKKIAELLNETRLWVSEGFNYSARVEESNIMFDPNNPEEHFGYLRLSYQYHEGR